VAPVLTAEEIRDVNTRYHDVAADHYDHKWGIDFGDLGHDQVLAKVRKALHGKPGHYQRSLEIGSGTGYFTLNMMRAGLIGQPLDRRVRRFGVAAGGLEVLLAPARLHLLKRPWAAGEDLRLLGGGFGLGGHTKVERLLFSDAH